MIDSQYFNTILRELQDIDMEEFKGTLALTFPTKWSLNYVIKFEANIYV